MSSWTTADLVGADKKHIWHPFTDMHSWCAVDHEPLVLVRGQGALLWDSEGRVYIDGNSSIWTNIHGHNHPRINQAITEQLQMVGHTSFLGFTNSPAVQLAVALCELVSATELTRVFYTDNGSTGIEVSLRIAQQYWQLQGEKRTTFVAFDAAYHGDTAGAASLGSYRMFKSRPSDWRAPICFFSTPDELLSMAPRVSRQVAGVVIEPRVQGAAGIKLWPAGTLRKVRDWCDAHGALLIFDEVMTGFGRTGSMFAFEHENVSPDILVLGKGLTGGYLPLGVTFCTEEIFSSFVDKSASENILFYGHSYAGNALGCCAALASLRVFDEEKTLSRLQPLIGQLATELELLRSLEWVTEIRQCGFIAGVELCSNPGASQLAASVCIAARKHGLLTRAIRDVVVLMPPLCITSAQLSQAVAAIRLAILETYEGSDLIS